MDERYDISNFNTIEDIRKPREKNGKYTGEKQDLYDSLINIILNHKKEISKVPLASSIKTAQPWAEKRGLRAGVQDLDGDGTQEVVVYDKAGRPIIINGYKLRDSDFALRQAYFDTHTTKQSRIKEPSVNEWGKRYAYDSTVDPNNPWITHTRLKPEGQLLEQTGYKMPVKPKKTQSIFNIFTKLIAPLVKKYWAGDAEAFRNIIGAKGDESNIEFIKKIISPIVIYRMLYVRLVEKKYFQFLNLKLGGGSYQQFKNYIRDNPNRFWGFFKENYLTKDLQHLTPKINIEVIKQAMCVDDCDWDGSDINDVIIWLLGLNNCKNPEFVAFCTDGVQAAALLQLLKRKGKAEVDEDPVAALNEYRTWRVKMEDFKEDARRGQKQWFNMVEDYFNGAVKEDTKRFAYMMENGLNPFAEAKTVEEVGKAGSSSPMKEGKPSAPPDDKGTEGAAPEEAPQSE